VAVPLPRRRTATRCSPAAWALGGRGRRLTVVAGSLQRRYLAQPQQVYGDVEDDELVVPNVLTSREVRFKPLVEGATFRRRHGDED